MKAKEYFEKYFNENVTNENVTLRSAKFFRELIVEVTEIAKQRNIKIPSSITAIFKEQQLKVNAVNKLFIKKHKTKLFIDNAFILYCKEELKEFRDLV